MPELRQATSANEASNKGLPMMEPSSALIVTTLPERFNVLAPDGSEIRLLRRVARGSMAHGTLPPGAVSLAMAHRTVEEIWFVIGGAAQVWRKIGDEDVVVAVATGDALTIPLGAHFQFRTLGDAPFTFIMCTMPPWPGEDEAIAVAGVF